MLPTVRVLSGLNSPETALLSIAIYIAIECNSKIKSIDRSSSFFSITFFINEPPCCESLQERLTYLCTFANQCSDGQQSDSFIHPLIKAIILHFMIGHIHPFGDGNGRTARAIFYWFMLKNGYWLFEYVSISKLIQEKRSGL
jgi:Fic family protein